MKVALATRDHLLAERSLHELEHLMRHNPYADYPDWQPTLRADLWLAQGQLEAATDWAEGVVFPQGAWEGSWSAARRRHIPGVTYFYAYSFLCATGIGCFLRAERFPDPA